MPKRMHRRASRQIKRMHDFFNVGLPFRIFPHPLENILKLHLAVETRLQSDSLNF